MRCQQYLKHLLLKFNAQLISTSIETNNNNKKALE